MRNLLLGLLAALLLVLFFIYTSPSDFRSEQDIPFSSEQWQSGDAQKRAAMAKDLMHSDTLLDLSRQQTLELLGKPDVNYEQVFLYNLDFGHSWWPDAEWTYLFKVHFDSTEKVIQAGYSD